MMAEASQPSAAQLAAELEEARRRIVVLEAAASDRTLAHLTDTMLDGFSLLSNDGVHLDVNPALCAMTGFSRDELIGVGPPHPYWAPDAYPAIETAFAKTLSGDTETFPLTFMRKSGERFPVLVTPSLIRGKHGGVLAAYATVKDVSELQRSEATLARSEELFRLTFDQAPIGAALAGLDFRFQRVNARFAQMTGYSTDELLQRGFPDITHPDDVADDVVQVKRLTIGETDEYAREKRYVRKDGSVAWGQVVVRPVKGDDGRPLAFVAMVADVTERRLAELALRESEDKFKYVFDHSSVGKSLTLPAGQVNVNDAFCRMLGYTRDEFDQRTWQDVTHPDDIAETDSQMDKLKTHAADSVRFVKRNLHKDGSVVWVDISSSPRRDQSGEPLYFMSTMLDITERKRAEDEIRRLNARLADRYISRTEQMEAATRELEALAYSIAHDVRAPLRAIDGFSALLIRDERERLSPEGVEELRRVRVAAQTLAHLMDELIGLSNVSRRELVRQTVDLSGLAEDVGEETAAEETSRHVDLNIAPGLTTVADPALLRLILRELLGNAWKFTRGRALAHVEVGAVDVDGDRAFFVRDDGAGFDMHRAEHLFGVFQRLHTPQEFEGDGVGLAVVQRLVRRHGGRVWAHAEVDEGATFYFTLPGKE
jgi:PAS domain S-box-containing protein